MTHTTHSTIPGPGGDTRPGNASDYLFRPELLVSGHSPLVPECPGYFCTVSIFCTRPACQLVPHNPAVLQAAAGAQAGWKLEDEAALKLLDDAVCDCHVVQQ